MQNNSYIKHIVNPSVLYLMWKDKDGSRHKVGELFPDHFDYLSSDDPGMIAAKEKGFEGFPAFNIDVQSHSNPLPVFIRRCPPKDRRDFDDYLKAFALDPDSDEVRHIPDFTLLGYTGSYITANPFNLINPFKEIQPPFEFVMQVAGANNYLANFDIQNLVGEALFTEQETTNKHDHHAVILKLNHQTFGYIPRGLNHSFIEWMNKKWIKKITIRRINGQPDHRYAYVFVEISN